MRCKVGIAGLGVAGMLHARTLAALPGVELLAADPQEARRKTFQEKYGVEVFSAWTDLLKTSPKLDALVLCTTTQLRDQPIRACCENKLPFFCEKPPAHSLTEARPILETLRTSPTRNAAGFQYRWHPLVDRMRALISNRPPLFARSLLARPMFPLTAQGKAPLAFYQKSECGGPIIEQGSHFIDLLRFLISDEPLAAFAAADPGRTHPNREQNVDRDCEETSAVILRHASGMLSTHVVNWSHNEVALEIQLVGQDYDLTWSVPQPSRLWGRVDGQTIDEQVDADLFEMEMHGFLDAVVNRNEKSIRCCYEQACKTLAVCEAAARSVEQEKWISVEPI